MLLYNINIFILPKFSVISLGNINRGPSQASLPNFESSAVYLYDLINGLSIYFTSIILSREEKLKRKLKKSVGEKNENHLFV